MPLKICELCGKMACIAFEIIGCDAIKQRTTRCETSS